MWSSSSFFRLQFLVDNWRSDGSFLIVGHFFFLFIQCTYNDEEIVTCSFRIRKLLRNVLDILLLVIEMVQNVYFMEKLLVVIETKSQSPLDIFFKHKTTVRRQQELNLEFPTYKRLNALNVGNYMVAWQSINDLFCVGYTF